uniref:Transcription elongation factor SPT4 homolog n=1 Tax=Prasinoderma coloniale TaxID=156133 RepID=A0A6U0NDJ1_9VIRI|eukprot:PRCOL_00005197-RA
MSKGGARPSFADLPLEPKKSLRCCLNCKLVKTFEQFIDAGCDNCPFLNMQSDQDRVTECTSSNFDGIISVMKPQESWASRWLKIERTLPGCYAVYVAEQLPQNVRDELEGR